MVFGSFKPLSIFIVKLCSSACCWHEAGTHFLRAGERQAVLATALNWECTTMRTTRRRVLLLLMVVFWWAETMPWCGAAWGIPMPFETAPSHETLKADDGFNCDGCLAVFDHHACAVNGSGKLGCWGRGMYNMTDQFRVPVFPPVSRVTTNKYTVCGVSKLGHVTCQCAQHTPQGECISVLPEHSFNIKEVALGGFHYCIITKALKLACGGSNSQGQIDVPYKFATSDVTAVCAGTYYTCALTIDHRLGCWGDNNHVVGLQPQIASMSCGGHHVCGVTRLGAVKCWGQNSRQQCNVPPEVAAVANVAVTAGDAGSCALDVSGKVRCWGVMPGNSLYKSMEDVVAVAMGAWEYNMTVTPVQPEPSACVLAHNGTLLCVGPDDSMTPPPEFVNLQGVHPEPIAPMGLPASF